MRVNINMDEDLVKELDKKASALFVSRSAYVSMVVSQALSQEKMMQQLPVMLSELARLNDHAEKLKLSEKSSEIQESEN